MGHRDYEAVGNPLPAHPTVVLINHDTASAAEILASALADHHLATIVGTRSFGKGIFQEVLHLAAGGALDLTVGEYLTADGISLAGKGIKPDVHAVDDPKTPARRGPRQGARRPGGEGGGREQVSARGARSRSGGGCASVERRGRFAVAEPLFERGPQAALARGSVDVRPGDIALVDFRRGGARALRALGSAERPRDVVAALLWDRGSGRGFPAALEDEAREAATAARRRTRGRAAT